MLIVFFIVPSLHAKEDFSHAYIDENKIILQLKTGNVEIKLRPDLAPKHVSTLPAFSGS